jgi:hypothetical protein
LALQTAGLASSEELDGTAGLGLTAVMMDISTSKVDGNPPGLRTLAQREDSARETLLALGWTSRTARDSSRSMALVGKLVSLILLCGDSIAADMGTGEAFEGELFKYGTLYPCIHIGAKGDADEIRLQVNWGLSEDHPFVYIGPFPPFPGSS